MIDRYTNRLYRCLEVVLEPPSRHHLLSLQSILLAAIIHNIIAAEYTSAGFILTLNRAVSNVVSMNVGDRVLPPRIPIKHVKVQDL